MNLDWKWIGIGALIMIALSLVAGIVTGLLIGSAFSDVENLDQLEQISLSGGQLALLALVNLLSFLIGGFIVGVKSAGRTILEPGISAAIAVIIVLAVGGGLTIANVITGGLVPFLAGVAGGWLGERRQAASQASTPAGTSGTR